MSRDLVIARYPHAVCESDRALPWSGFDLCVVYDIPVSMTHGVRWHGDVARGRAVLGMGSTEPDAWADASLLLKMYP